MPGVGTIIIGGGISGLSTAYYLAKRGIPSTILESRPRLGGVIQTERVDGCTIECWGHGSQFDLRSGQPLHLPAYDPVPVFAVEIAGDEVYVDVTHVLNGAEAPNFS